jgi:hypothetical protein
MPYYFFKKRSAAAHIWTGEDTACRMYSTGGLRKSGKVFDDRGERRVCTMCKNVMSSQERKSHKVEFNDMAIYLW